MQPSDLWLSALRSTIGIAIETDEPVVLRRRLYEYRKASGDRKLMDFGIGIPQGKNEVWIARKEPTLDD